MSTKRCATFRDEYAKLTFLSLLDSAHHVVLDDTSVVVRQRAGGFVQVHNVRIGEVVHPGVSTRHAHDRSVPSA